MVSNVIINWGLDIFYAADAVRWWQGHVFWQEQGTIKYAKIIISSQYKPLKGFLFKSVLNLQVCACFNFIMDGSANYTQFILGPQLDYLPKYF